MSEALCWEPSVSTDSVYGGSFHYNVSSSATPEGWGRLFSLQAVRRKRRFEELSKTWHRASLNMSSARDMFSHPAYRSIVAMGFVALPFMLEDLASDEPPQWFTALASITGINPAASADAGNIKKMAEAWRNWGVENGFLNGKSD